MILTALLAAGPGHARADDPYFPGLIFCPNDRDHDAFVAGTKSVHLKAMQEPSLWKLSREDRKATAYRFLWLHPGSPQISVRLTRTPGAFALHVAGHDGSPGLVAGRMTINRDAALSIEQGEKLVALLDRTAFWTSPVEVKENRGIADGDVILIEGVRGGKYHVIQRAGSAAGESYKAFCRALLALAGEPALLAEWDRTRQDERGRPGYRPEPTQTEDRGDPDVDDDAP